MVPITSPASTATVAMKPLNTRWMTTITASVNIAYASPLPLTGPPGMPSPDGVVGRDRQQRDADDRDHRAGHDRGEEADQPAEERGHEEGEQAGHDHRAVDVHQPGGAAAGREPDGDHRRHRGEGDALQQRQPDPDLPEADAWMIEAMPQVNRSALIRWTSCSSLRPIAPASRIGTMTAPA